MNKITVQSNNQVVSIKDNPMTGLPRWLVYLSGAYPNSKLSDEAFLVMEDLFSEYDPTVLYGAAREFAKTDERVFKNNPGGFPTASEFMPVVKRVQARQIEQDKEQQITAFTEQFTRHQLLRVRRLDVLEGWYSGAISDYELSRFAGEMDAAGLVSAAASLRYRLSVQTGGR